LISNFKFQISNSEKGVSLIITFFVLVIILAVVLSISVILYSEIKIIRNIGDSVVAFYAADSGIEKALYYDRQRAPDDATGSKRGICSLCTECLADQTNCYEGDCTVSRLPEADADDCTGAKCENCTVEFDTNLLTGSKSYHLKAVVSQDTSEKDPNVKFSNLSLYSVGSYNSVLLANPVKRGIQLDLQKDETESSAPLITNFYVTKISVQTGEQLTVFADVNTHGHGVESVEAKISAYAYGAPQGVPVIQPLSPVSGVFSDGTYSLTWSSNTVAVYVVDVTACDIKNGLCSTQTITNAP